MRNRPSLPLARRKNKMEGHNRIFVGWPDGYFVTSLDPEFHKALQEMVADLGPPSVVEFRCADEGWVEGLDEDLEVDDATEIAE